MTIRKVICLAVLATSSALGKEQIDRDVIVPVDVEFTDEVQTIEAAPTYECEEGATLNADGTCSMLVEQGKQKHHCPKGFSQSRTGDGCVKRNTLAPITSCGTGVISGKKCLSIETAPALMECARGYIMSETGLCKPDGESHHAKKHCGKGSRLEGDVCVAVQTVKPQYLCDSGNLAGTNCEEEETMAPVCKNGYESDGETCISHKHSKASHDCPKGYNSSGRDGECSKKLVIEATTECEDGSFMEGRNCVTSDNVAMEYKCKSKGFTLEGNKCVKYLEEAPVASCPRGYKEVDGGCVQHHNKRSNSSCPPNFELKGSKCIGEEVVPATVACRDGDLVNGECLSSESDKHAFECAEKGYKLRDGVCIAHHSKRAHKECPAGSIEEGHKCIIKSMIAPEQECERGEELLSDGLCGATETRAPDMVCPHGYSQGGRGKGHHDTIVSTECVKESYSSPTQACPAGYELDGRSCVSEETATTIVECEGGISKGGACLEIVTTKANAVCEEGFSMKRGTCYKRVTVQVPVVTTKKNGHKSNKKGAKH